MGAASNEMAAFCIFTLLSVLSSARSMSGVNSSSPGGLSCVFSISSWHVPGNAGEGTPVLIAALLKQWRGAGTKASQPCRTGASRPWCAHAAGSPLCLLIQMKHSGSSSLAPRVSLLPDIPAAEWHCVTQEDPFQCRAIQEPRLCY